MLVLLGLLTSLAACQKMEDRSAYGTLERDRLTLLATDSEIIVQQAVSKGSAVQRGDLLLQLDTTRQQARVAQAQAEVGRLRAALLQYQNGSREEQVASARARVSGAQTHFNEAEKQWVRIKQLRSQSLVAAADLDQAQLERDLANAQLTDYQQQLRELETGTRVETIAQAQAAVQSAEAALAQEQKHLEDLSIRATRDGVLEDFPWQLGERVPAGAVAAIMVADTQPYARLFIPEPSLAHYKVGDTVKILVDGRAQPLQGRIRLISQQASFTPHFALYQTERTRLMYVSEVLLDNASDLPTGIPLQMPLP